MTTRARLRALRLVGFKSFAEKTTIEFGPGISAIVGPNGSGKSNLADALRWSLGEAGRLLRTRRAEDVIFAGSSARRAIGMADVTLLLDNGDRLLPLDYEEIELGRRLYRSGENEYLLNRQRVRLRDLVELLDAGNLADNAFLFIGQGMVDQALALRPEERRPLFEEAAGVRRHERRRRQAEAELAEAELNLERLRDVLGELRPQARRLAAQAEQLEARHSAGLELAQALVAAARTRWIESASGSSAAQAALADARSAADRAMAELRAAEVLGEQLSTALGERADKERAQRGRLDELRRRAMELRLAQARRLSELDALARDRQRLADERGSVDGRIAEAQRVLALPLPEMDDSHAPELAEVERELAEITGTLENRSASASQAQRSRREQDLLVGRLRQQRDEAERRLAGVAARSEAAAATAADAEKDRAATATAVAAAVATINTAEAAEATARQALDVAAARHAASLREANALEALLSAQRARLAAVEQALEASVDASLARQARARGGSLLAEGLVVDPNFRLAVAAALGEAARGLAVDDEAAVALRGSPGLLLLPAAMLRARTGGRQGDGEASVAAAVSAGGGRLVEGIRRDPGGHVSRLLARTLWVAALEDALALRAQLLPGWRVVTLAGEVISDEGMLRLAGADPYLQLRAERDELAPATAELATAHSVALAELAEADSARDTAQAAWHRARAGLDAARSARRVAEETERAVPRRAESAIREADWAREQRERLARELDSAAARLADAEQEAAAAAASSAGSADKSMAAADLEARLAAIRARRERLRRAQADAQARQRAAEETHRRAEVALTLDEARLRELDEEAKRLATRESELVAARDRASSELATAEEAERRAEAEVERLAGEGADERARLLAAERAAIDARERLRAAESRSRTAEVAAMEARLQLESMREQLLVELAGIGLDALEALRDPTGPIGVMAAPQPSPDVLASTLESALDNAVDRWQSEASADGSAPAGEPAAPSAGRLAALRRRFHELGAGNPFAADEYAAVRERLEQMETQREDLEAAISNTRQLIDGLSNLIAEQFRATFAALEGAFARRFTQLFDGGEAELSLTDPHDLGATGIEITARPPGKKRQPLSMLSGGERALTAVALLFAMLEVRPVPFCVLDEVDAALDEANIGRFSAALRSLADEIQFIVITHNRGTIEAADALYGVTIGDDAVSRIVSLRLPDHADTPLPTAAEATTTGVG